MLESDAPPEIESNSQVLYRKRTESTRRGVMLPDVSLSHRMIDSFWFNYCYSRCRMLDRPQLLIAYTMGNQWEKDECHATLPLVSTRIHGTLSLHRLIPRLLLSVSVGQGM